MAEVIFTKQVKVDGVVQVLTEKLDDKDTFAFAGQQAALLKSGYVSQADNQKADQDAAEDAAAAAAAKQTK